jgi:hypothetical protein
MKFTLFSFSRIPETGPLFITCYDFWEKCFWVRLTESKFLLRKFNPALLLKWSQQSRNPARSDLWHAKEIMEDGKSKWFWYNTFSSNRRHFPTCPPPTQPGHQFSCHFPKSFPLAFQSGGHLSPFELLRPIFVLHLVFGRCRITANSCHPLTNNLWFIPFSCEDSDYASLLLPSQSSCLQARMWIYTATT